MAAGLKFIQMQKQHIMKVLPNITTKQQKAMKPATTKKALTTLKWQKGMRHMQKMLLKMQAKGTLICTKENSFS